LYDSAKLACKQHTWELVLVSPFDLPEDMIGLPNVSIFKDFGQVSRCVQRGMLEVQAPLVFLTVDDCVFLEDSIDKCLDDYKELCSDDDILNMRYSEGGDIQPPEYYAAGKTLGFLAGIEPHWYVAPQFIISVAKFIDMGGFDCQFEYINECVHDFSYRVQRGGGHVYHSSTHACVATWYEGSTGDHKTIFEAQTYHDWPIFVQMYRQPNDRYKIPYENWRHAPAIWARRFTKGVNLPTSYGELVEQEGYII
jgi:hypothetical protein